MSVIARVTAKGQTTIPQEIRALLGVKPGDGGARGRHVEPDAARVKQALGELLGAPAAK